MKVILIFAFLALATCSSWLNATDFCSGFSNETKFTASQIQNCLKCVQSNNSIDITMDSSFTLNNSNPNPNLLRDAFFHAIYPNVTVSAECQPYVADLQGYFSANMTSDQLLKAIDGNLNNNLITIMLNFATWRLTEVNKDSFQFGNQGALLFKFVTGADDVYHKAMEMPPWPVKPPQRFLGF